MELLQMTISVLTLVLVIAEKRHSPLPARLVLILLQ
jgi:hypothetical protein